MGGAHPEEATVTTGKRSLPVVAGLVAAAGLGAATLALSPGPETAAEQLASPDGWEVPRTPWGAPDLQGIWDSKSTTPLERPAEFADREFLSDEEIAAVEAARARRARAGRDVRAERGTEADVEGAYNNIFSTFVGVSYSRTRRSSLIVDPPDGRQPPRTPLGAERQAAALAARARPPRPDLPYPVDVGRSYDNPEDVRVIERCLGVTLPCIGGLCGYSRLVQSPGWVGIYYEQGHGGGAYRSIPLDGRPHLPPGIRQWLGDSVGHWEGDTLVVDTTNFTDRTDFLGSRENLHLVERFTRIGPDLMRYRITVDDPAIWTRPWTIELAPTLQDNRRNLIFEAACHEGNYALTTMLAGARLEEAEAEAAAGRDGAR